MQLKSFLGLTNYFRDFVRDHSTIVHPLNSMLINYFKTKKLEWTKETSESFHSIKAAVAQCTTMHFLNDTDPIFLHTDASGYLFQVVDGKEHPIAGDLTVKLCETTPSFTELSNVGDGCDYVARPSLEKFILQASEQSLKNMKLI
jgi:hypothetical protein